MVFDGGGAPATTMRTVPRPGTVAPGRPAGRGGVEDGGHHGRRAAQQA